MAKMAKIAACATTILCASAAMAATWSGTSGNVGDGDNWGGTAPAAGEALTFADSSGSWLEIYNDTALTYGAISFSQGLFKFTGDFSGGALSLGSAGDVAAEKSGGNWTVGGITAGKAAGGMVAFTNKTGNLSFSNILLGEVAGSKGVFVHESGSLVQTATTANQIGGAYNESFAGSEGVMEINGGNATFKKAILVADAKNSKGRYVQRTSGAVTVADWCRFGRGSNSSADFAVSNGTFSTSADKKVTLAQGADSTGSLTVSGSGAAVSFDNSFYANSAENLTSGDRSKAYITIADGGTLNINGASAVVYAGAGASSTSSIVVDGGALKVPGASSQVKFGYGASSDVSFTVTNNGTADFGYRLWIPAYKDNNTKNAKGKLLVASGGKLTVKDNLYISDGTGSITTAAVEGATATVGGAIVLGNNAVSAVLSISNATVTADTMSMGYNSGSVSSLVVDDGGVLLLNGLYPARNASSATTVTVKSGGTVDATRAGNGSGEIKFGGDKNVGGNAVVNLDGGKIRADILVHNGGANNVMFNFNGGMLETSGVRTGLVADGKDAGGTGCFIYHNNTANAGRVVFNILEGGGTFNLSGNPCLIQSSMTSGAEGGADGGFTIESLPAGGTLTLSGTISYTGPTTVKTGAGLALRENALSVANALVLEPGAAVSAAGTLAFQPGAAVTMEFSSTDGDSIITAGAGVAAASPVPVTLVSDSYLRGSDTHILIAGGQLEESDISKFYIAAVTENGADMTDKFILRIVDGNLVAAKIPGFIIRVTESEAVNVPAAWVATNLGAGYDEDVDDISAEMSAIAANGLPYWQSYCLGLTPANPDSVILCELADTQSATAGKVNVAVRNLAVPEGLAGLAVTAHLDRKTSSGQWTQCASGRVLSGGAVLTGQLADAAETGFFRVRLSLGAAE